MEFKSTSKFDQAELVLIGKPFEDVEAAQRLDAVRQTGLSFRIDANASVLVFLGIATERFSSAK